MHVCHLCPPAEFYSPISGGAVATVIMQQSEELLKRGHRVSVLAPATTDEMYSVGEIYTLRQCTRETLNFAQRRLSSLRQKLNNWDWPFYDYYLADFEAVMRGMLTPPDVVIVHNDLVSPKYLKRIVPRAQVLVWLHNEQRTNQPDLAETVRCTDAFVCVSDYIRRWTAQQHPGTSDKLATILNGVDVVRFSPRTQSNGTNDLTRVLFIGRIDPNKGPHIVADAVATLRRRKRNVNLTVAGGLWWYGHGNESADPFFRELQAKMQSAEAQYIGHVTRPNVPALIRAHDVVCVLSRSNEPFGLVALEAMASGCAVLASNRGGLPEACGPAALLVDPDDFESVVDSLDRLAGDQSFLNQHKQSSLLQAQRSTWGKRVDQLEALFNRSN